MPKCHSTNDIAADLASNRKISEGTVISTHNQTRGRGQRGNNWESLPGQNLTFSIIFFPAFLGAMQQIYLNYAISCGIIDYLDNKGFRGSAQVKWPNDIYLEQKKIGGILIENTLKGSRISQSVSGIGLNLNQVEFNSENATSLKVFSGLEYDPEEELERILIHIEQMYIKLRNSRFEFLKDYYLKRLFRKDEWHRFRDLEGSEFSGCIRDIDESGRLIVESDQQIRKFNFKEIEFIS